MISKENISGDSVEVLDHLEINTGQIFNDLKGNWRTYDQTELRNGLLDRFINKLNTKKIFANSYKANNGDYRSSPEYSRYLQDAANSSQKGQFPFTDYFYWSENNSDFYKIVFNSNCIVTKTETDFDYFFFLKLLLLDIMEMDDFLNYQLARNFEDDFEEYSDFLTNVCFKYKEHLGNKHEPLVTRYIKKVNSKQVETPTKVSNKEFTTSRQVLAIHYILKELKVNDNVENATKARFAQFLTGKETGASEIKNTTLYKKTANPFPLKDKTLQKDLQFIREFFENLDLQNIVNQINKEISSK